MKPEILKPEEIDALLEEEFHNSNKLWGEISTTYANQSLKLFDDIIKFVYQALTAMGLVVGFGFAGIQGVQNILLFFIGESVMFSSMMFGFYRIKVIYTKNVDSIEEMSQKVKETFEKNAVILGELMKKYRRTRELDEKTYIQQHENYIEEMTRIFRIGKKQKKYKDESWFITWMIIIFAIGFVFLLLSFFQTTNLMINIAVGLKNLL